VETLWKEYSEHANVIDRGVFSYYQNRESSDKLLECLHASFEAEPRQDKMDQLKTIYLEKNELDKVIEVAETFRQSPAAQERLSHAASSQLIGRILLQQGKIEEAAPYFVTAARTNSAWGNRGLAQYYEITGHFSAAEEFYLANRRSYPEIGPYDYWAFNYTTNRTFLREVTDEVLERYVLSKSDDEKIRAANPINNHQIIYTCYCMDLPYPEQLGKDPLVDEFNRSANGVIGFLKWFELAKEALEKDTTAEWDSANWYLRRLRQLCLHSGAEPGTQRSPLPILQKQNAAYKEYQKLAALFMIDQKTTEPGKLNLAEVEFLLRGDFTNDLEVGVFPWMLYVLGRYYDMYGHREKAIESYRRALSVRGDMQPFLRCLVVKELKKFGGMVTDNYVQYSWGDPQFPRFKVSHKIADVLCRQLFRVYTDSPSATMLAKPVAETPDSKTDFDKTAVTSWTSGLYRVTKVLFRGEAVSTDKLDVYWKVPRDNDAKGSDWSTFGIAHVGSISTQVFPQRENGLYPLKFGREDDVLSALSIFYDADGQHRLVLTIAFDPSEEPRDAEPTPDTSCVRIEMTKVAELP
jgi:tetratricopeptide (TPR) repeat protein